MSKSQIKFITLTSAGYQEYTLNMLSSLKKINLDKIFKIYCLDEESFNKFNNLGYETEKYQNRYFQSNSLQKYGSKNFNVFMYAKMEVIRNELFTNKYVFYSDGDVVFKKNFQNELSQYKNYEILAMKDFLASEPDKTSICAGFMCIKSNLKTRYLFNPKHILKNNFEVHDQQVLNSKKKWINYRFLNEDLFPNGSYFINNIESLDPFAIHFNYIVGDDKKKLMKKFNYWFVQ